MVAGEVRLSRFVHPTFWAQDDTPQAFPSHSISSSVLKPRTGCETREEAHFFSFIHFVLPVGENHTPEKIHSARSSSSLLLDMQIYSPSVKMVKRPGLETLQPQPVFCDEDKIEGRIMLDPSCSENGRLTISVCFPLHSFLFSADKWSAGRSL